MPKNLVRRSCFAIVATFPFVIYAQNSPTIPSQANSSAHKDSTALSIVSRSLTAVGGSEWAHVSDFQLNASATTWNGKSQSLTVTISGRNTGEYRFSLDGQSSDLKYVATRKDDRGQYAKGDAAVQPLPPQIALSDGIYFPLPLLFDAVTNPQIDLSYKGTRLVSGIATYMVELTQIFPKQEPNSQSHFDHFTKRILYFDSTTGFLIRISYYVYSDKNANSKLARAIDFSAYAAQQGFLCPGEIREYQGPQLLNIIHLQSLVLNTGLPDDHFHLSN
jgi:hypothetical protein